MTEQLAKVFPILLVNDESLTLQLLELVLNRAGYPTLKAASGREAIDICRHQPISLVVLDLLLPDPGAGAVVTLLRGDPVLSRIPILLTSSEFLEMNTAESRAWVQMMFSKTDDYLRLPFSPFDLVHRVRQLLPAPT